jgi:predicted TIM-barrel fold metal-dependent hydrolase
VESSAGNLNLDWLISVDDHVLEPPDVWISRVPARDRDRAPHLETDGDLEFWAYDGKRFPHSGLSAVVGKSKEEFSPEPLPYSEMRPGCYNAAARVEDMNQAGVLASLCFPSLPRFCGQLFYEASDREFGFKLLQIYNDWMIDEWCGAAPGRYIPCIILPLWDPKKAAAEVERCAAKGAHALTFSENPYFLGLPTVFSPDRYWDPVWRAAADADVVVCMHVGSSSNVPEISPDTPFIVNMAWMIGMRTSAALLTWLFSGLFDRFPKLNIALSEGGIGWIPWFVQRAQQVVDKQHAWISDSRRKLGHTADVHTVRKDIDFELHLDGLNLQQVLREHVYGCFIDDPVGIVGIDYLGVDNVMAETDYPHSDSNWPDSITLMRKQLAHLPVEDQVKILRTNAERVFHFTPAAPPA